MHARMLKVAGLAVMLAVAAAGCGRYSITNIRSLKAFQDANNLYRKADYQAAIERYQDAVTLNPELGFAYFFLGNSYDNLYKPSMQGTPEGQQYLQQAVDNYRVAIEKMATATDPKELEIRNLAYQYLIAAYGPDKLDDFDAAEPIARELIAAQPDEPGNYQALGRLYEEQGLYEEAEAMFIQATEVRPTDPLPFQSLAGYYSRQGDFEKTMEAFRQRAEREPNNPEAWHTIAVFNSDQVQKNEDLQRQQALQYVLNGLEASDRTLALNPEYYEALVFKNILLRQQALLETSAAVQERLIDEAEEIYAEAQALRERQQGSTEAASN